MSLETMKVFDDASDLKKSVKVRPCFGIDLGTTNSAISVLRSGKIPDIIKLDNGSSTLPSCVLWTGKGDEFIVGHEAYKNRYKANAIYSVKRIMGSDKDVVLKYGNKEKILKPEEVSALILRELANQASKNYGEVKDVVITVPAYFDNKQLEATRRAGELAGLNVLKTFREPTSASLLYNIEDTGKSEVQVLVYDLGGGTFDVSLVKISQTKDTSEIDSIYGFTNNNISDESGKFTLSVLRTEGDSHLGGDDIDNELYKILEEKLIAKGVDVKYIPNEMKEQLKLKLESKKKDSAIGHLMNLNFKLNDSKGTEVREQVLFTTEDLFRATEVVYRKTKKLVENTLSGFNPDLLDSIVLVGGSTKSPLLKSMLRRDFPSVKIDDALNPDESVALGAAVEAHRVKFGDNNVSVFDVLPLSIGILADGEINKLIMRNQVVPYSASKIFTNTRDNQEQISVHVYQGNSNRPEECVNLGSLIIKDIPKGKAHTVKIQVKLEVNAEGILQCGVLVGDTYKKLVLTNLFTGKESESKDAKPSIDKVKAKKVGRWRSLAKSFDPLYAHKLNELLDSYMLGEVDEKSVIEFIQAHRKVTLNATIRKREIISDTE